MEDKDEPRKDRCFFIDEGFEFDTIKVVLVKYLEKLVTEFDRYIPDPFDADVEDIQALQEELFELENEEICCRLHSKVSLDAFWTQVKQGKPVNQPQRSYKSSHPIFNYVPM